MIYRGAIYQERIYQRQSGRGRREAGTARQRSLDTLGMTTGWLSGAAGGRWGIE
jgi:hypothetical protein